MWRAFLVEQSDPDHFYEIQADDTVAQLAEFVDVGGKVALDVGGGAGWFTAALRRSGAVCFLVEPGAAADRASLADLGDERRARHAEAVRPGRLAKRATVAGDGLSLPFRDRSVDVVLSSNVLEHVADPAPFVDEAVRVTTPGGMIYLSFTAWLSPWGGHETAPWHYLGGHFAVRRYIRRHGRPPGNLYGSSLFARYVGATLRLIRSRPNVEVIAALPRYHPTWLQWVVRVPGLREVATWNLLVVIRRRDDRGATLP